MEIIENYNDYLRSEKKSHHTINSYNNVLKKFFKFVNEKYEYNLPFDNTDLIDRKIIREYLVELDKQQLSPNTRNQSLYAIKSFFSWLYEDIGLITSNPADTIKSVKIAFRNTEHCSVDEIKTIFAYIKKRNGIRNKAILSIAVICGLRCEEIVNLNVYNFFTENGIDCLRIIGKGDKERSVFLSPECSAIVREYMTHRMAIQTKSTALFLSERTKDRMGTHAIYDLICEIKERCGVNFHPHKLRHTAGTFIYAESKDIAAVQEVLGHSSIITTRRYVHIPSIQSQKAINNSPLNGVIE